MTSSYTWVGEGMFWRWASWSLMFAVALGVAAGPVHFAWKMGVAQAADAGTAWQDAAVWAFVAVGSIIAPSLSVEAWRAGTRGLGMLGIVASAFLLGLSVHSTATVELGQRAALVGQRDKVEAQLRDLRATLADVEDRIDGFGARRTSGQVEADMRAERHSARWAATKGCSETTNPESRAFCANIDKLFGELAGAQAVERERARADELRGRIADALGATKSSTADREVTLVADMTGWPPQRVETVRSYARAFCLELLAMVLMTLVLTRRPKAATNEVEPTAAIPAVTMPGATIACQGRDEASGAAPRTAATKKLLARTKGASSTANVAGAVAVTGVATSAGQASATIHKLPVRGVAADAKSPASAALSDDCSDELSDDLRGAPTRPVAMITDGNLALAAEVQDEVSDVDEVAVVASFVVACLRRQAGSSLSASEVLAAFESWCGRQGLSPVSQRRLGSELTRLGFERWQSCGRVRYRDAAFA